MSFFGEIKTSDTHLRSNENRVWYQLLLKKRLIKIAFGFKKKGFEYHRIKPYQYLINTCNY